MDNPTPSPMTDTELRAIAEELRKPWFTHSTASLQLKVADAIIALLDRLAAHEAEPAGEVVDKYAAPILHAPGCKTCDFFRANDAEWKAMEVRIAAHNGGRDDD